MTQPHQSEDATMKPVALSCPLCSATNAADAGDVCCGEGCPLDLAEDFDEAMQLWHQPPEWDRGEATQPVELYDEATWQAIDLERNVNKGERLARRDDQYALDEQIQFQGAIGELPR